MTDFRKSSSGLPHTASSGTRLLSRRRPRFAVRPLALALAGGSLLSLLPGMTPNVQAQAVPLHLYARVEENILRKQRRIKMWHLALIAAALIAMVSFVGTSQVRQDPELSYQHHGR